MKDYFELNGELYLSTPYDTALTKSDYSYSDYIFELVVDITGLYLKMYNVNGGNFYNSKPIKVTKEELETRYIPVKKFLRDAEYIGRAAHRTDPTIHGDKTSFQNNTVMLYKGKTHVIVELFGRDLTGENKRHIHILDQSYADDNWEYTGEQLDIYSNPEDVLTELHNRVLLSEFKEKIDPPRRR